MPFISYARNYEDVLLWRALGTIENGRYIDAGATHPDDGSVTRAFYDHGWSGINATAHDAIFARLAPARPRDVNLHCAVGAGDGCRNLAEICRTHAPAGIHLLRIDLAGAERAALEGADLQAHRPWIVVVTAVDPATQAPTHEQFDGLLSAAGYHFAWFDGLNRFYLAAEHDAALRPHFSTPPNVFDDFIRPADAELARRMVQMQHGLAALQADAGFAALRAQSSDARVRDALQARAASRELLAYAKNEVTQLNAELAWRKEMHANAEEAAAATAAALRSELERHVDEGRDRESELALSRADLATQTSARSTAEAFLKAVQAEVAWYKELYAQAESNVKALRAEVAWLRDIQQRDRDELQEAGLANAAEASRALESVQGQAAAAEARLNAIEASRSWRLTGPVRRLIGAARR